MRNIDLTVLTSVFSDEMRIYLEMKAAHGFQMRSYYYQLKIFDQFCLQNRIISPVFTMKDAHIWSAVDGDEGDRRYCNRFSVVNGFLKFLNAKGYNVAIPETVPYKKSNLKPHIYTDDEISRYFNAIDKYYKKNKSKCDSVSCFV